MKPNPAIAQHFSILLAAGKAPDGRRVELRHVRTMGQDCFTVEKADLAGTVESMRFAVLSAASKAYFDETSQKRSSANERR